ncbi:MAG TPA: class I SAM-dependent methyltransferase [Kofleriaceae bacterium]|nr:class I SAM-dependent methyltransferase [Kofleriaceae bacterium]
MRLRKFDDEAAREPGRAAFAELARVIGEWERGRDEIRVLEAGGGSLSHVPFRVRRRITLVDISPEQLERNQIAERKILGDLHDVDVGTAAYDAVVCFDVLEHLERPGLVLDKLCRAVGPDGILVVAGPNPRSLTGLITKWTPHWFHVLALRHVLGDRTAGQPGRGPFRTYMHRDAEPERLRDAAERAGLEIAMFRQYESRRRADLHATSPWFGQLYDAAIAAGNRVTGRPLEASDFFMVAHRAGAPRR